MGYTVWLYVLPNLHIWSSDGCQTTMSCMLRGTLNINLFVIGKYLKNTISALDNSSIFPFNYFFLCHNVLKMRFNVNKPFLFSNTVLNLFFTVVPASSRNDLNDSSISSIIENNYYFHRRNYRKTFCLLFIYSFYGRLLTPQGQGGYVITNVLLRVVYNVHAYCVGSRDKWFKN